MDVDTGPLSTTAANLEIVARELDTIVERIMDASARARGLSGATDWQSPAARAFHDRASTWAGDVARLVSVAETARLATKAGIEGKPFAVHAPLQYMTKADIVREAARLGLDPAWSWSCYDPMPDGAACGLCDSCRLRLKGFAEAGRQDPLNYAGLPDAAG